MRAARAQQYRGDVGRRDLSPGCFGARVASRGPSSTSQEVKITRDAYGPVMVLSCWAKGYHEPLYVVSNMDAAEEACRYDQKRFRIRDFFLRPEKPRCPYCISRTYPTHSASRAY